MPAELLEEALIAASTRAVTYLRSSYVSKRYVRSGYGGDESREFDLVSERIILGTLKEYLNNVVLVSEESGVSGEGDWMAIVDPVDGSINFEAGIPISSVSIGLARSAHRVTIRDIEAAVVAEVYRDVIYYFDKQRGFRPIGLDIKRRSQPSKIVLGYFDSLRSFEPFANIVNSYGPDVRLRSLGSAALDVIYVALGMALGFIDTRAKLRNVDIAASVAIANHLGSEAYLCDGTDLTSLRIDGVYQLGCVVVGYDSAITRYLLRSVSDQGIPRPTTAQRG